jgi:hypothetical protein
MEIFPSDLDKDHYVALLRRRMSPITWAAAFRAPDRLAAQSKRKPNRHLVRLWTAGLDLPPEEVDTVGLVVWNSAHGTQARIGWIIITIYLFAFGIPLGLSDGVPPEIPGLLFAAWVAASAGMALAPKYALRKAHGRQLELDEVEGLLPAARGRLDETFLNLIRDALRTGIQSPTAEVSIRQALKALGGAIAALPADRAQVADARSLAIRARELRDQAAREPDPLLQASLQRQAASVEERARTGDETARIARRVQALRREVREQMDSLRNLLMLGDPAAVLQREAAAERLTDSVRQLSRDAYAASVARQELAVDDLAILLGGGALPAMQPAVAPRPAPAPEQQQVVQQQPPTSPPGRAWWRGA